MSFKTASAIARGTWLINRGFVRSNIDLILDVRKGSFAGLGITERQEDESAAKLPLASIHHIQSTQYYNVGFYTSYDMIPSGSVAIVQLIGPVLKYGDMCSYGMVDKAALLNKIAASGKFKSIILNVDSPGGQADGTQLLAGVIKNIVAGGIPVIAVVDDGMMASAAMWIGSACSAIYATKVTDTFGSIGVYMTIFDFREMLKQMGIEAIDIYADQSTDKNKAYHDALDGDDTLLKESLNFLAATFISAVQDNRGSRLNTADEDPFTGKMYTAQAAVDIGLIDGIKDFDEILTMADALDDPALLITPNNQINMFGKDKFKSLSALAGVAAASITAAQVASVNEEITAANIDGVTLALDSDLNTADNAVNENAAALTAINAVLGEGNHKTTLTEALAAFTASASATGTALTAMTADRDNFKALAAEYGAKGAAEPTTTTTTEQDKPEGDKLAPSAFYSEADAKLAETRKAAGLPPKKKAAK